MNAQSSIARRSAEQAEGPAPLVVLAGGVGGSKLAEGLAGVLPPGQLIVIGNVGDDVERHGLWVSPDLDILTYTLADEVDREKGWGLREESFRCLEALGRLGEETWMKLGDLDLATHIYRTALRRQGERPTKIALRIAERFGVSARILVPTDNPVQTRIRTAEGWLHFQEYFVREQCRPEFLEIEYAGAAEARPTPEALAALSEAAAIVIAPSNPLASIGPILAVPGLREAIRESPAPTVAVCPIVGGCSLKGPSDRMLRALGYTADPLGVASCYDGLLDGMVVDRRDEAFVPALCERGLNVLCTETVMDTREAKTRLAGALLAWIRGRDAGGPARDADGSPDR